VINQGKDRGSNWALVCYLKLLFSELSYVVPDDYDHFVFLCSTSDTYNSFDVWALTHPFAPMPNFFAARVLSFHAVFRYSALSSIGSSITYSQGALLQASSSDCPFRE
jgi:hypothetical protein